MNAAAAAEIKAAVPQAKGGDNEERIPVELTVAPGRVVTARLPRSAIGKVGVVTIVPDDKGRLNVIWESWSPRIRLTKDFPERTGLPASPNLVKTWLLAGFVEGEVAGPNSTWVDLTSLKRFLDKIKAQHAREFWTPDNQRRYLEAKAEVYSQGLRERVRLGTAGESAPVDPFEDEEETSTRPAAPAELFEHFGLPA